jgi:hypothetical protein
MWNGRFAGKLAFNRRRPNGYLDGTLFGEAYVAHRIIWKMVHGTDPETIDHINGDRSDNKLTNLRSVSLGENLKNQSTPKSNTSGAVGVSYDRRLSRWRARIGSKYLGIFPTKEAAVAARAMAAIELGYHPNHGRERNKSGAATSGENVPINSPPPDA